MELVLYVAQWLDIAGLDRASGAVPELSARFVFGFGLELGSMDLELGFMDLELDL